MALKGLFRKDIEPRCGYCRRSGPLDGEHVTCRRKGIVRVEDHCRAFQYDPLCRIPPKPAVLRGHYTDADFSLEAPDET